MLTDIEKQGVRLLIRENPDPDYMASLAADDEYALAELAEKLPEIRRQTQNMLAAQGEQLLILESHIEKGSNAVELINSILGE